MNYDEIKQYLQQMDTIIHQQQKTIEQLKNRIDELESDIEALKERVNFDYTGYSMENGLIDD